ncbi:hypothetical protein SSP24_00960 [Streptomyces spinoverrucosus]|uniref:Uncharacterized protein n=1 Tax=Streptomyces spinoverrucosus TaxID=284043 RepID=A0A4Y3VAA1_9ACTN|nr:hypothetical protein SSP24_00960 [Streptomyces spinoverrucosus]
MARVAMPVDGWEGLRDLRAIHVHHRAAAVVDDGDVHPAADGDGVAPRGRVGVLAVGIDDELEEALRGHVEAAGRLQRGPTCGLARVAAAAALPREIGIPARPWATSHPAPVSRTHEI